MNFRLTLGKVFPLTKYIIIVYLLQPILVFIKCFNKKWYNYLCDLFRYLIIISIILYISNKIIAISYINLNINNWIQWIFAGIMVGLIYILISIPIFLTDKGFRSLIKDIISKFKKS